MAVWHENFPRDVFEVNGFLVQQRGECNAALEAKRARKALILAHMKDLTIIDENDPSGRTCFRLPRPARRTLTLNY
jgi:hypothetical protein